MPGRGRTLGNQSTCSFLFLTVQGVGILPDLLTLQLPLRSLLTSETRGSVGSVRAGGPEPCVSRASSDQKQGNHFL